MHATKIMIALGLGALLAACPGPRTTGTGIGPGSGMGSGTDDTGTGTGTDTATVAPDPAPVVDGDVTDAWVHGMHILVKRIPGAETTSTQLYILGGVRNWGKDDAGIEQLGLQTALDGGTERLDRDAFTRRLSDLGSSIGGGSGNDFAVIGAWSLAPAWDETFALLVDAFRHPAMPASQLELERAQQLSALKHEQEDPDSRLDLLVDQNIYAGHPYANRAIGTMESVGALTAEQIKTHLAGLRETSRLMLVVVGDLDANHVIEAASATLGDLPRGSFVAQPMPRWTSTAGKLVTIEDKLPTNYIKAVVPGPSLGDPEFPVAWVAMTALGAREFEEVRTKRNLSYAPSAYLERRSAVAEAVLYVTAVDPIKTLQVMFDEAKRMRDQPMPDRELAAIKATLLTRNFTSGEAPADQGTQLAESQLIGGDWHLARTLIERTRAVTAEQVQAWAAQHLTRFQTFAIGDKSKLDQKMLEAF